MRVGVDLDGTLADLSSAYHEVERGLFGDRGGVSTGVEDSEEIEESEQEQADEDKRAFKAARRESQEQELVWAAIRRTEDFWLSLRPLEPDVVRLLHEASVANGWETFFITQRPSTAGQTVQRQTQQWLMREGFETPSVLTLRGGRGRAAAALELDVLLDDLPKNCVDVVSESRCRPILILRQPSAVAEAAAKQLRIGVARSVAEAIDLAKTSPARTRSGFVSRILGSFARS